MLVYLMMQRTFVISFLLAAFAVVAAAFAYARSGRGLVSPARAKAMIADGTVATVVDVRTDIEFKTGHHPRAIHLPASKMNEEAVKRLELDNERGVLTYCNSGQRARAAAEKLRSLGFKQVYYISGTYSTILD